MSAQRAPASNPDLSNRPSEAAGAPSTLSAATLQQDSKPSTSPVPHIFSSQSPALSTQSGLQQDIYGYSASTTEILNQIRAKQSPHIVGTSASFQAKRAEIMQNYMTSDRLPTPPPIANTGKRGKTRGRFDEPTQSAANGSPAPSGSATPARGGGRGRGRGRGRGGGRGGKRKRDESSGSDNDSDISDSYTPVTTRTKSGRNVNKPVVFVPTLPEPTRVNKRQKSAKAMLAAQCSACHRGTDPAGNRIVFCDMCNTAYHQWCHNPPIDNEVVDVLEKEWLCGPCERSKQVVIQGTEGLVSATGLSLDDKRAYLSTLPKDRLVSLLLHATIRHPELPIFPPNIEDLIPERPPKPAPQSLAAPNRSALSAASPANGVASASNTPHSQRMATDSSEVDPAEAQLLGEFSHSHLHRHSEEYEDGYDSDPPAHYPKPGNGLARNLPPESEDLEFLVDDNTGVYSHNFNDAMNGHETGEPMDGVVGSATANRNGKMP